MTQTTLRSPYQEILTQPAVSADGSWRQWALWSSAHPGVRTVHVGNGRVSDLCGGLAADIVFAKGTLAEALAARGAPYEPFETLHDVVAALQRRLG